MVLKSGGRSENLQAGYGLPELPGTIAVFGGGANTAWLQAEWLKDRRIGYWGGSRYMGAEIPRRCTIEAAPC
ncbi:Wadjet anti-phage system protein JetD domain-containing protein [Pseudomonas aeruginosa]